MHTMIACKTFASRRTWNETGQPALSETNHLAKRTGSRTFPSVIRVVTLEIVITTWYNRTPYVPHPSSSCFIRMTQQIITGTFGDMGSWSCVFVLPYRTKLPKPWGAVRSGSSARLFYFACVCVCVCCCVWKRLRPLQTVHIGRAEIFAVIIISSTSFISSPGNFWFRPSFNQNIRYFNSFANNPCPKGECHLFDFAWRECDTGIMSSFACKAEIPL